MVVEQKEIGIIPVLVIFRNSLLFDCRVFKIGSFFVEDVTYCFNCFFANIAGVIIFHVHNSPDGMSALSAGFN